MLNPFFYPYRGGTENHLQEVTKRLAKKHEITILTSQLDGTPETEDIGGVHVVRTPSKILNSLPGPIPPPMPIMPFHGQKLYSLAKENELVHMHNRFIYGLSATSTITRAGKPLCITLHNATPKGVDFATDFTGQLYDNTIGRVVFSRCAGALAVSRHTMEHTMSPSFQGVRGIAYNGVNFKIFRPQRRVSEGKKKFGLKKRTVLTVARLVKQKGLEYLIRAMKGMDAKLFILGRGPQMPFLLSEIAKNNVDATIFTEKLSDSDLALLYASCDVFALPSLLEPFGMVVAEAMACEKPVVASRVGGIPEIVEHKKSGLLVEPADPNSLRKALSAVFADPKAARRMALEGRKRSVANFTWDNTAKAYEKFYSNFY